MDITVSLELDASDLSELSNVLQCNESDIPEVLSSHGTAAIEEYVRMFLGEKVFSRGSDILEYRLFLLIRNAFSNRIPDEHEVCRYFQTTITGSRSLIRSVMSKYQYLLNQAIENSVKSLVESAEPDGDEYIVTTNNMNMIEELNRQLGDIDGRLPQVSKKRLSVSTYNIAASSYARLCRKLGITPRREG